MAPSATEAVTKVAEHIKEKVIPDGKEASDGSNSAQNTNESNDLGDKTEELPKLNTAHREPLKLAGVLDQFEHFDVTPVIGREFAGVDLAEWLRAPNSDELLRDLAITGKQAYRRPSSLSLPFIHVSMNSPFKMMAKISYSEGGSHDPIVPEHCCCCPSETD